jgi:hypothetical protein
VIKKILLLLLSVVLVLTLVASYVSAASPLEISKYDVTKTSVGAQLAQEAVQRWTGQGWNLNCNCSYKDLKVYEINPGDYLVAPALAKIELESVKQPNGSVKLEPRIVTGSPSDSLLQTEDVSPMQAPYWLEVESWCFARLQNFMGWIDNCYAINKLMGETDSQYDYYELTHYATAASKYPCRLQWALLTCRRNTQLSSTMYWKDWYPKSDQPVSSCGDITLGITVFGVGLSYTSRICSSGWDITKYDEAGRFANRWYGSARASEREVAYMVCVKVPQNGYAIWDLTAGYGCSLL